MVEFCLSNAETFRWKAAGSSGNWGSSSEDVVCHSVFDWMVVFVGLSYCREFLEN